MKHTERRVKEADRCENHETALAKIVKVLLRVPAQDVDALLARVKTALEKGADRRKLLMAGAAPIEVPQRVGNGISRAVENFALQKKLDPPDLWYHDEPIWFLRSKRNDLYRAVQIAAFSWKRDECLFFIPQAFTVENGSVRAAKQKVVEGLITSLPLRKLESSDEDSIAKHVENMLPDAWSKAESISEKDLELVKGRK